VRASAQMRTQFTPWTRAQLLEPLKSIVSGMDVDVSYGTRSDITSHITHHCCSVKGYIPVLACKGQVLEGCNPPGAYCFLAGLQERLHMCRHYHNLFCLLPQWNLTDRTLVTMINTQSMQFEHKLLLVHEVPFTFQQHPHLVFAHLYPFLCS
jgi:hypothetical protein